MKKTPEDRKLGDVIAPVKEEDSEEASEIEIKAKILGVKAEEGKETEKSGYSTKQMVEILSIKAEELNETAEQSENSG